MNIAWLVFAARTSFSFSSQDLFRVYASLIDPSGKPICHIEEQNNEKEYHDHPACFRLGTAVLRSRFGTVLKTWHEHNAQSENA
jgi:hypothetical protein